MKNRIGILIMVISLLFSGSYVLADSHEYLKGHWAEDLVNNSFIDKHFDYLLNDENTFDFNTNITKEEFMISLYSIINEVYPSLNDDSDTDYLDYFKEKGILSENEDVQGDILLRKDAVRFVISSLENIQGTEIDTIENKYTDLQELSQEDISYILKASNLGIVKGYPDSTFKPNKTVNQIEAIIILKRLEGELIMNKNQIPFNVISTDKGYDLKEEAVNIQELEDKVIINITKKFPTSGYSMTIDKVVKESKGKYNIYLKINKPSPDTITLQVITYRTLTIEIEKKYLEDAQYNFSIISVDNPFNPIPKQNIN